MEDKKDILKRYYQADTTLDEEKQLKEAFQKGDLQDDPILSYRKDRQDLPKELIFNISTTIHKHQHNRTKSWWVMAGSIAAMLILIVSLRYFLPMQNTPAFQLSDNLKKERFENALRVIGNALDEKTPVAQKVLYEDNNLIIAIE